MMKTNMVSSLVNKIRVNAITLTVVIMLSSIALSSQAVELGVNYQQGQYSETKGGSIYVADKFYNRSNFYWTVSYNQLNDAPVEWNNKELFFDIETVDALVSYRYSPSSYFKSFINDFTFEYQAGVSVVLTENKLVWPALQQEMFFSESGDANAVVAFSVYYNFSRNAAFNFGIKHQPSFSNFDSLSSVHLGFSYKFGQKNYDILR